MKAAEEQSEEDFAYSLWPSQRRIFQNIKKQIQLDSWKQGMRDAAEIAHDIAVQERIRTGKDNDYQIGARNIKQAILAAIESRREI